MNLSLSKEICVNGWSIQQDTRRARFSPPPICLPRDRSVDQLEQTRTKSRSFPNKWDSYTGKRHLTGPTTYEIRRSGLLTWKYQFSYGHWSQAILSSVSTWIKDYSSVAWVLPPPVGDVKLGWKSMWPFGRRKMGPLYACNCTRKSGFPDWFSQTQWPTLGRLISRLTC